MSKKKKLTEEEMKIDQFGQAVAKVAQSPDMTKLLQEPDFELLARCAVAYTIQAFRRYAKANGRPFSNVQHEAYNFALGFMFGQQTKLVLEETQTPPEEPTSDEKS